VTTEGAFHRQGPFLGSGGLYSPGPATAAPPFGDVATAERRSHVILGLSRSFTTLAGTREGRLSSRRFARHLHRRSHAEDCALLGPRSLAPPPFFERCARAYSGPRCCLPTSATNHDVRTLSSGLSFLAGTMAMTTFLFFRATHDLLR